MVRRLGNPQFCRGRSDAVLALKKALYKTRSTFSMHMTVIAD